MANNRMFLIHKPTKLGVMIGKRMIYGWYEERKKDELQRFFDYLSDRPEKSKDDFILAMEDCEFSTCFDGWVYTNDSIDGFRVFEFTGE